LIRPNAQSGWHNSNYLKTTTWRPKLTEKSESSYNVGPGDGIISI
jgi:hypothetical protein